jgi:hypothetical protein
LHSQGVRRGLEKQDFTPDSAKAPARAVTARQLAPISSVARLHWRPRMDEHQPILPPPPPLRVALWALLNVLWFRLAYDLGRRGKRAVKAARQRWLGLAAVIPMPTVDHGPASIALLAREGRLTSLVGRLAQDRLARATFAPRVRTERPTKVERRRTPR